MRENVDQEKFRIGTHLMQCEIYRELHTCEISFQFPFNNKQNNESRKWHTLKYCLLVLLFIKWTRIYELISAGTSTYQQPHPNLSSNTYTNIHTHTQTHVDPVNKRLIFMILTCRSLTLERLALFRTNNIYSTVSAGLRRSKWNIHLL